MTVAENIKKIRKEKGLTQKQLGEKCKMSESTLRQYELGLRNPKLQTLTKIATALGVSLSDIMGKEEIDKIIETKSRIKHQIDNGIITTLPSSLLDNYSKLNDTGKREADKRVQELTEIPRYTQTEKNLPDKED